jgi:hypothetical protein
MEKLIRLIRGKNETKLYPELDPAAWMALYHYAEYLEVYDPKQSLEIHRELYSVYPDRANLKYVNRWNEILKEITHIRRYQLKDLVENNTFYDKNIELDLQERNSLESEAIINKG